VLRKTTLCYEEPQYTEDTIVSTKNCSICKQPFPLDGGFGKNRSKRDGLQDYCKQCSRDKDVLNYQGSADRRQAVRDRNNAAFRRNREHVLEYLRTHPCVDCGITDTRVLEFDHRDPSLKDRDISMAVRRVSLKRLKDEISKCDVRCANCHRIRTLDQFGRTKE
jgi:hypothetical protein